jgi:hypothetical protein
MDKEYVQEHILTDAIVAPVGGASPTHHGRLQPFRSALLRHTRLIYACSALRACVVRAADGCPLSWLHRHRNPPPCSVGGCFEIAPAVQPLFRGDMTERPQVDGDAGRCGQQSGQSRSRVASGERSCQASRRLWRKGSRLHARWRGAISLRQSGGAGGLRQPPRSSAAIELRRRHHRRPAPPTSASPARSALLKLKNETAIWNRRLAPRARA